MLVYPIGIPAGFFILMLKDRQTEGKLLPNMIYQSYKGSVWWWECAEVRQPWHFTMSHPDIAECVPLL